jgi:hypothetical protein
LWRRRKIACRDGLLKWAWALRLVHGDSSLVMVSFLKNSAFYFVPMLRNIIFPNWKFSEKK